MVEGFICQSWGCWTSLFTPLSIPAHKGWPSSEVRWQLTFLPSWGLWHPATPYLPRGSTARTRSLYPLITVAYQHQGRVEMTARARMGTGAWCSLHPSAYRGLVRTRKAASRSYSHLKGSPLSGVWKPIRCALIIHFRRNQKLGLTEKTKAGPAVWSHPQPASCCHLFPCSRNSLPAPFCLLLCFGWVVSG